MAATKNTKKQDRCWPKYEPVEGKKPYSKGSCRPKAKSKLTGAQSAAGKKTAKKSAARKRVNKTITTATSSR